MKPFRDRLFRRSTPVSSRRPLILLVSSPPDREPGRRGLLQDTLKTTLTSGRLPARRVPCLRPWGSAACRHEDRKRGWNYLPDRYRALSPATTSEALTSNGADCYISLARRRRNSEGPGSALAAWEPDLPRGGGSNEANRVR